MSSFGKRQLEKYGWTDGKGIGKDSQGVKTFIAVQRRPIAAEFAGIGHSSNQTGSATSTELTVAYDAALHDLRGHADRKRTRGDATPNCDARQDDEDDDAVVVETYSATTSSDDDEEHANAASPTVPNVADVVARDKALFERCGQVRLGRCGRHRFFDGKLSRISNASKDDASNEASGDGYLRRAKEVAQLKSTAPKS